MRRLALYKTIDTADSRLAQADLLAAPKPDPGAGPLSGLPLSGCLVVGNDPFWKSKGA